MLSHRRRETARYSDEYIRARCSLSTDATVYVQGGNSVAKTRKNMAISLDDGSILNFQVIIHVSLFHGRDV